MFLLFNFSILFECLLVLFDLKYLFEVFVFLVFILEFVLDLNKNIFIFFFVF